MRTSKQVMQKEESTVVLQIPDTQTIAENHPTASRVQSPSSIKTFKQCPRKYYYSYILELETTSNIYQVRGNIAHSVLEHFFDIETSMISLNNYEQHLKLVMQNLLLKEWQNYKEELVKLELSQEQEIKYFEETLMMLFNWTNSFCQKIAKQQGTFQERFKKLTPIRELRYVSQEHAVQGFIDAIEHRDCGVCLMDYKTSSKQNIDEHLLQLGIYSLLYYEKHGVMPKQVGVYFLKGEESILEVDEELVEMAKKEIAHVHENTQTNNINDYPKQPGGLCKWSSGQCDFYNTCRPFEK